MIRESISRVLLKEYGGEQLVLPFDGDTRAYNYMQYIDFIKRITKPGEITSNIQTYDDYCKQMNITDETLFEIGRNVEFYDGYCGDEFNEEEYNYFIAELENKYGKEIYYNDDSLELSDYGDKCYKEELTNKGRRWLKYMLDKLFSNAVGGMVYLNRVLTIPQMSGRYSDNVDGDKFEKTYNSLYELLIDYYGDLGYYWAYGTDNGSPYCGDYFKEGTSTVSLLAMTPIENIDIADTCGMDNAGECEVSLKNKDLIMLVGLKIDGKEINLGHRVYK